MEFSLTPDLIAPFIASNVLACLIFWRSFRNPILVRGLLGVLFVTAAIFNVYHVFTDPSSYLRFADTAMLEVYKHLIRVIFSDHAVLVVSAIAAGQLYIGMSIMYNDWRFRSACVGGMIFGLAIAPLGIGLAFPSSFILSLSFLSLMIVFERERKLNQPKIVKV
jgi:hypothetical protein